VLAQKIGAEGASPLCEHPDQTPIYPQTS